MVLAFISYEFAKINFIHIIHLPIVLLHVSIYSNSNLSETNVLVQNMNDEFEEWKSELNQYKDAVKHEIKSIKRYLEIL